MKKPTIHPNATLMVGVTRDADPVWQTDNGRPFILDENKDVKLVKWRWRWPRRWAYRRLKKPHLSYAQVAVANEKSKVILSGLRNGPLKMKNGFVYNRANRVIMTKAIARVVLHWMAGCGFVFKSTPTSGGYTLLDLDTEATTKNGVG
jgi:hypothetical protein